MATKKLIDLHKEWCESGMLPKDGLCNNIPDKYTELFYLFEPKDLFAVSVYWGCGVKHPTTFTRYYGYTPLRQTIVLLICAMKNEL